MKASKKRSRLRAAAARVPGPGRTAIVNKFIAKHRKLEPILKILLTVTENFIVELDVNE